MHPHKSKRTIKKSAPSVLIEYIGWIGVSLLLLNYVLLSSGLITGQSYFYHGMSLIGSLSLGFEAWHKRDRQPAVLNFIFVSIAIYAIARLLIVGGVLY